MNQKTIELMDEMDKYMMRAGLDAAPWFHVLVLRALIIIICAVQK